MEFSSLNPYESLEVLTEDSPQLLVGALKQIRTPIKIVSIVASGTKFSAFIVGDIRIKKTPAKAGKPPKEK